MYYSAFHCLVSRVQRCLRTLSVTTEPQRAALPPAFLLMFPQLASPETLRRLSILLVIRMYIQHAVFHNMICNPTGVHINYLSFLASVNTYTAVFLLLAFHVACYGQLTELFFSHIIVLTAYPFFFTNS